MTVGGIRRGTTPTHTFGVDLDLRDAIVFVHYTQNGIVIVEKTGKDVITDEESITVTLSQQETLKFEANVPVCIQISYVLQDGTADKSNVIVLMANETLKDGEMPYV